MKKVDRYIVRSIITTMSSALFLIAFIILLFDTFKNLDFYLQNNVSYLKIGQLALYYFPQALVLALGPALLFSTTYFLSHLYANNEMIILSNSGYSFLRIIAPIMIVGLLLVILQFSFSENIALVSTSRKEAEMEQLFGQRTISDNRNVALQDPDGSYVIYASRYSEESKSLYNAQLFLRDKEGRVVSKVEAMSATYEDGVWTFHQGRLFKVDFEKMRVKIENIESYSDKKVSVEPSYFRNLLGDISTMPLVHAIEYVKRFKTIHMGHYISLATDLYDRLFSYFIPLLLVIISCTTLFSWKKNILILSIISSLVIAVVYYVIHMITIIFAKQGIISPIWGSLAPIVVLLLLSLFITLIRKVKFT